MLVIVLLWRETFKRRETFKHRETFKYRETFKHYETFKHRETVKHREAFKHGFYTSKQRSHRRRAVVRVIHLGIAAR